MMCLLWSSPPSRVALVSAPPPSSAPMAVAMQSHCSRVFMHRATVEWIAPRLGSHWGHNPASTTLLPWCDPPCFARRRVRYAGCVLFERVYEGCDALCGPSLRVGAALSLREEEEEEGALLGLGAHMGMKMSFTKNPMKPSTAKPSAVRSEILVNSAVPQTPNKHQDLINHETGRCQCSGWVFFLTSSGSPHVRCTTPMGVHRACR